MCLVIWGSELISGQIWEACVEGCPSKEYFVLSNVLVHHQIMYNVISYSHHLNSTILNSKHVRGRVIFNSRKEYLVFPTQSRGQERELFVIAFYQVANSSYSIFSLSVSTFIVFKKIWDLSSNSLHLSWTAIKLKFLDYKDWQITARQF